MGPPRPGENLAPRRPCPRNPNGHQGRSASPHPAKPGHGQGCSCVRRHRRRQAPARHPPAPFRRELHHRPRRRGAWRRWSSAWPRSRRRWSCSRPPAGWRSASRRPWPRPACRSRSSTRARSAPSPAPRAGWPRPTAWTPRRSPASPRRSGRRCAPLPDEATRHLGALVARRRQLLEMLVAERNRRQRRRSRPARADRRPPPLARGGPGRDRAGPGRGGPGEPGLARQGGAAPLGAGRRAGERAHAAGRAARARLPHPSPSRRPGRGGAVQPRQRQDARQAHDLGRPGGACGPASTWPRSRPRGAATRRSPASTERLRLAGKPAKLALTACMRKLVVTLNAMLRTDTAWKQA